MDIVIKTKPPIKFEMPEVPFVIKVMNNNNYLLITKHAIDGKYYPVVVSSHAHYTKGTLLHLVSSSEEEVKENLMNKKWILCDSKLEIKEME